MICSPFPEANQKFTAPPDMDPSQVSTAEAYVGSILGGNLDGHTVIVVAWKPTTEELEDLNNGGLVYLSVLGGGLPPHFVCTQFPMASYQPPK